MKSPLIFSVLWLITLLLVSSCSMDLPEPESSADPEPALPERGIPLNGIPSIPLTCPDASGEKVSGFDVTQPPQTAEPEPRSPYLDPVFGSCVVRVTDRNSDIHPDDPSTGLKNEYARVQSFNADSSLLLSRGIEGTWYLYDAVSLQSLGQLPLDIEPRWSATDPWLLYYISETRLMEYEIRTGQSALMHDFLDELTDFDPVTVWTRYEGSPSMDSRWWGLMAEDEDWLTSALLVYDLEQNQVTAVLDIQSWPEEAREIDSVSISPLGNYFLAFLDRYCEEGAAADESNLCGLMVYDRNLETGRSLLRVVGHADTALDADGREVLVYQDIDNDTISMLNLESGLITPLHPIDFSHTAIGLHFSGRAFNKPGWVVVSTHDGDAASHTWMDDQVFALELKPGGQVIHLAHTHSIVDENQEHDYWAEPHASVNPDFSRVVFTSNRGRSGSYEVEMYMIHVPDTWLP